MDLVVGEGSGDAASALVGSAETGQPPSQPDQLKLTVDAAIKGLLDGTTPMPDRSSNVKHSTKEGDFGTAQKDWDALPGDQTSTGRDGLKVKTMPDGRKAIVRPGSSEGSPTLEIQRSDGDPTHKIRYKQ
jgi:hypothetical protein